MNTRATFEHQTGNAAELYDRTFVPAIAEPASDRLMHLAALQADERVLDLACGTGIIARKAATAVGPSGSVVGVDVSSDMIAVARAHDAAEPPIDWHVADAASLPFEDESFDVVLCQLGLMFVDRDAALAEARRVLRPGGRFVANTGGAIQPLFEILDQALVRHVNPDLGGFVRAVFSLHDPEDVAVLLQDAGFDHVRAESRTVHLELAPPADFLWAYIGSTPLGAFVGPAPDEAQRALEDGVVARWQEFVGDDGRLTVDQPMVDVVGISS